MTITETFLISSRKPLVHDGDQIIGLSIEIESTLKNVKNEDKVHDIFHVFIEYDDKDQFMEEDHYPVLFIPDPSFKDVLDANKGMSIDYKMRMYKEVCHEKKMMMDDGKEYPVVDPVELSEDEFFSLLNNRLHFDQEANRPCYKLKI